MKVCTFQVGDIVTIDTNAAKVEKLQKGHGEWVETMRNVSLEHTNQNSVFKTILTDSILGTG